MFSARVFVLTPLSLVVVFVAQTENTSAEILDSISIDVPERADVTTLFFMETEPQLADFHKQFAPAEALPPVSEMLKPEDESGFGTPTPVNIPSELGPVAAAQSSEAFGIASSFSGFSSAPPANHPLRTAKAIRFSPDDSETPIAPSSPSELPEVAPKSPALSPRKPTLISSND